MLQKHNHSHNHSHSDTLANTRNYHKAFSFGIALIIIYIIVEVIYGLLIIADAGHYLSNVFGLLLAWSAEYLTKFSTTSKRTYDLRQSTILAVLFNVIILLIAVGAITIESIRKILGEAKSRFAGMMVYGRWSDGILE